MPNLEIVEVESFDVPHVNVLDLRCGRAAAQLIDEPLNGAILALDMRVDPTVRAVANPPGDAQLIGLLLRPCPEKHALNAPGNRHVPGDVCHGAFETCV